MGESSYDKICSRMAEHKKVQEFLATIPEKLAAARVVRVDFVLERPEEVGKPARAVPKCIVEVNGSTNSTPDGRVWIALSTFITDGAVRPLIDELFGQPGGVPTYFCKKEILTGEKYDRRRNSFAEWLRANMVDQYRDLIAHTVERLAEEAKTALASEENVAKSREFLVRAACEDIKKALASYSHLGSEVLKAAVDEYLVHSIFEFETDDVESPK